MGLFTKRKEILIAFKVDIFETKLAHNLCRLVSLALPDIVVTMASFTPHQSAHWGLINTGALSEKELTEAWCIIDSIYGKLTNEEVW